MASLKRIVLVDTWGDELFSGSSLMSDRLTPVRSEEADDAEEPEAACPKTLRSAGHRAA